MPVATRALGTTLGPHTIDVSLRMTLAYAAAIGDVGPRTFDDAAETPIVAPPAFCVVLEWPVLSAPGRVHSLDISADEARRAVHVEQDSIFHRVVRPGDRLLTSGCIVGVRQTRAGALVHTLLETSDLATGAAVVTTLHASLYRDVDVDGPGGAIADLPARATGSFVPARTTEMVIRREMPHVYTECTGIWNPIHTERHAALAAGLPDIILHGTTTWALAGREIVREHAGGDPSRLRRLRAWFGAPVIPGTSITLREGHPVDGRLGFTVTAADGRLAIADGSAEIAARHDDTRV